MVHEVLQRLPTLARRAGRFGMASCRREVAEMEKEAGLMAEPPGPVEPLHEMLAEVCALRAIIKRALRTPVAGERVVVGPVMLQVVTV